MIQFVLLVVILNLILYTPLLTIIEERKEYILTNLGKASEILAEANKLTTQYEQELTNVRKEAQLEITNSQKIHKDSVYCREDLRRHRTSHLPIHYI